MPITIIPRVPELRFPGADLEVVKYGGSCTQASVIGSINSSPALGAPFIVTVIGGKILIDPTDKSKSPYTAFKAAMAILCP